MGSSQIGFLINTIDYEVECIGANYLQMYACRVGLMANPSNPHKTIIY